MSKELKGLILREFKTTIDELDEYVVVALKGMKVEDSNQLRTNLRENGARMVMVKNSIACLALKENDREGVCDLMDGPTAFVFGGEGVIPIAKKLKKWCRQSKDIVVQGGLLSGKVLSSAEVDRLSTIPGRETLLSQVLAGITSPATSFLNLLSAKFREFANCVNGLREKMEEGGEQ